MILWFYFLYRCVYVGNRYMWYRFLFRCMFIDSYSGWIVFLPRCICIGRIFMILWFYFLYRCVCVGSRYIRIVRYGSLYRFMFIDSYSGHLVFLSRCVCSGGFFWIVWFYFYFLYRCVLVGTKQ